MPFVMSEKKTPIEPVDIIDVDSSVYISQKSNFIKNLIAFHDQRGTSIHKIPHFGGKQVDLYLLYKQVTKHGGWEKVSTENNWDAVYSIMYPDKSCANADYALKQIYARYLYYYEKYNFYGLEGEVKDESAEADESRRNLQHFLASIPVTYNYSQHPPSGNTNYNSNYHSLERSLCSGLPNEVDFAVNVCLLLSNDSKHCLRGTKAVKVIELLLSHVGVLKPGSSYKWQHKRDTHFNFYEFWNESVDDEDIKDLVCPESLLTKGVLDSEKDDRMVECGGLPRLQGTYDKEGQRISQIVHIIRNFLADDVNVELLAPNLIIFRFLMLCVYNKLGNISQLGLEALTYLSSKLSLDPVDCKLTQLMVQTMLMCLRSNDRAFIIRGCEMLSNVAQSETNEESLEMHIKEEVVVSMTSYLTLHDLHLSMACLEALYQLSEASSGLCCVVAMCHKALESLIAILTLDAPAFYGCIALEMASEQQQLPQQIIQQQFPQQLIQQQIPQQLIQPQLIQQQLPQQLIQQQQLSQQLIQQQLPQQLMQQSQILPQQQPQLQQQLMMQQPLLNQQLTLQQHFNMPLQQQQVILGQQQLIQQKQLTTTNTPNTINNTLQPQINQATQQLINTNLILDDKEKLAHDWLITHYEYSKSSMNINEVCLSKMDVYRFYVSERSFCGLQNIISPNAFEKCIRMAFSDVEGLDNILRGLERKNDPVLMSDERNMQSQNTSSTIQPKNDATNDEVTDNGNNNNNVVINYLNNTSNNDNFKNNNINNTNASTNNLTTNVDKNNEANSNTNANTTTTNTSNNNTSQNKSQITSSACNNIITTTTNNNDTTTTNNNTTTTNNNTTTTTNNNTTTTNSNTTTTTNNNTTTSNNNTTNNNTNNNTSSFKYYCDWADCQSAPFEDYNKIYQHVMTLHLTEASTNNLQPNNNTHLNNTTLPTTDNTVTFTPNTQPTTSQTNTTQSATTNTPPLPASYTIDTTTLDTAPASFQCKWAGCNFLPRMKWSFAAHLLDRHLNKQILQLTSLHRSDPSNPLPPPQPPTIYPHNAALQAIRKLTPRMLFHELMEMKEDRVSKHMHLTAALLIRNLARYSLHARGSLRKYEAHLANLAFSSSEASLVLSNCLWELHSYANPL